MSSRNSKLYGILTLIIALAGCGGGGGSGGDTTPGPTITLSGQITFESVPLNALTNGLNFNASTAKPARQVEVQLLNQSSQVLATTRTDDSGQYTFDAPESTQVQVRVLARMLQSGAPSWNVTVADNTSSNALYGVTSSLMNSGTSNLTINLLATTGWSGAAYTGTRQAAPFAILDTIYESMQLVLAENATTVFPELDVFWSENNSTASGSLTSGNIGSSFYTRSSGVSNIYILGAANDDTDEFDEHVIAHEWCHYFQDRLSRDDSIGGSHSLSARLDFRVAYSEGICNAMSAMVLNDSRYQDSNGPNQATGFGFDLEGQSTANLGWYNEDSVGTMLYDIFDADDDGADTISAGFSAIHSVWTSSQYTDSDALISIQLFLDSFKQRFPSSSADIDALASAQNMVINDAFGTGETNDAGFSSALPVYHQLTVGGPSVTFCSDDRFGVFNKLANRIYGRFTASTSRNYTISVVRSSGATTSDPDFNVHRAGTLVSVQDTIANTQEIETISLSAGNYVLEVFEADNVFESIGKFVCFDVEID